MYFRDKQQKGSKGSVQFKNTKGRLQIVFSYPVEENGEIKRKRFYISTGYEDTPLNRQLVGNTVRTIQRDIDYGEIDLSLEKYKFTASLSTVSTIPPISPNPPIAKTQLRLDELWSKYSQFKNHRSALVPMPRTSRSIATISSACLLNLWMKLQQSEITF